MDAKLSLWLVCLLFVCHGLQASWPAKTFVYTAVAVAEEGDDDSNTPYEYEETEWEEETDWEDDEWEKETGREKETGQEKEAEVLPMPMCFPRDFNSIVEKECAEKKYPVEFKNETRGRSREQCETEVTARELQKAIRQADPNCVAQIVIQSRSVKGIEEGFRIPPEFEFMQNFGFREQDPDIVAIKGLSLGVLQGETDDRLVRRLVAGLVPAFTAREGKQQEPKKPEPKKTAAIKDNGSTTEGPTTKLCNVTEEEERTENSFVKSQLTVCEEEKQEQKKKLREHEIDVERFEASLRDRVLLLDVFTANPNEKEKKYEKPTGRRLLDFARRRLQCSSCVNADSYVCAYCWQAEFCSQFYWCPEV